MDIVLQKTSDEGGSKAYSGKARVGKTTLAVKHINSDSRKTGFPKIVLDLGSVMSFRHLPHAQNVDEVLMDIFVKRVDSKVWTPESEAARRKFFDVAYKWGGVHILLDEIWNICDSNSVDPELVTLSNQYAHGPLGPAYLYFIGQRVMFINQKLFASIKQWYIFQSAEGGEQRTLRQMFGEKTDGNQAWPQGHYAEFDRAARPPEDRTGDAPASESPVPGVGAPGAGGDHAEEAARKPDGADPGPGPKLDQAK